MSEPIALPRTAILGYGIGSVGTGVFSSVPSVLLLYFLTQQLSLPVALVSGLILAPKILGIWVDPAIGSWSDRSRSAYGRRRPFMLVGSILLSASFVALFHAPIGKSPAETLLTAGLLYAMLTVTYSVYAVPYVTIPSEITSDARVRARILSVRFSFMFLGTILGAGVAPLLVAWMGDGRRGYAAMSWYVASASLCAMLVAVFSTPDPSNALRSAPNWRFSHLLGPLAQRPFRRMATGYAILMAGTSSATAAVPYFVAFFLRQSTALVGYWLLAMLLTALVAMTLWGAVLQRHGPARAFGTSIALSVAGALSLCTLGSTVARPVLFAAAAVVGVGFAGTQIACFAFLAEAIRLDTMCFGERREANVTGTWTAMEKLGLALGPGLVGVVLWAFGFLEGAGNGQQTARAVTGIRLAASVLPAVLLATGLVLMRSGLRKSATAADDTEERL